MAFEVVRSRASDRDLEIILDHLIESYQSLGDPIEDAMTRAAARLRGIEDTMEALGRTPHQGTLREDILPGLRQTTRNQTVFYFLVFDQEEQVRILAVFFGGQDHIRHMLARIGLDGRDG